jgi:hypothetical protein
MIFETLDVTADEFARATGWEIKPEGACRDERCVPLPEMGASFDLRAAADALRMPIVRDDETGSIALGPESGGRALTSARAPELRLRDWRGTEFALSSLRGTKVMMVAWASW